MASRKADKQQNLNQNTVREENAPETESVSQPIVPLVTKVKVIVALLVVSIAGYGAYWAQDTSSDVMTDVLQNTTTSAQNNEQSSTENKQEISIANFAFDPASLNVEKGATVTWVNKDTVAHNIVGKNFSSGTLNPGQSFSYTFSEDGTFEYTCTFHPQMKGTVVVGTGVNPTADATQSSTQTTSQSSSTTGSTDTLHGAADNTTQNSTSPLTGEEIPPLTPVSTSTNSTTVQTLSASAGQEATGENSQTSAQNQQNTEESTQTTDSSTKDEDLHGAGEAPLSTSTKKIVRSTKLADSGPEDVLYVAAFGAILYFNRKRLLKGRSH